MEKNLKSNDELKQTAFAIKWRGIEREVNEDIPYEKHSNVHKIAWKILEKSLGNKKIK